MRFSHPPTSDELLHLYAAPASPWTRANMVSTLDGRASGPDGRSGSINSAADQQVFACLRALSSVVVVGAGTVRAEGYGRLRAPARFREHRAATGLLEHPVLAVVTASGDLPEHLLEPDPARGRLLVLTTGGVPRAQREHLARSLGARDEIVVCGEDRVDPATAVNAFRARGLVEVLCEGGPRLLRDWVDAGVVDELCLTVRPLLLGGDGRRILDGAGRDDGLPLAEAESMLVLEVGDDLMLRYRLRPSP